MELRALNNARQSPCKLQFEKRGLGLMHALPMHACRDFPHSLTRLFPHTDCRCETEVLHIWLYMAGWIAFHIRDKCPVFARLCEEANEKDWPFPALANTFSRSTLSLLKKDAAGYAAADDECWVASRSITYVKINFSTRTHSVLTPGPATEVATERKANPDRRKYCSSMGLHRGVTWLIYGMPPNGQLAIHTCGMKACCKPGHLRWGTHEDNHADDRDTRQRSASRKRRRRSS